MAQIFISYSKKNIQFAHYLFGLLEKAGFDVWMDEEELVASERWWRTIEQNIKSAKAFVVIMSPEALESDWVEREILVAESAHKPIFPVLLAGVGWSRLANIQYEDMRAGLQATLSPRLINALHAAVSGTQPSTAATDPTPTHTPPPPPPQTESRKLEAAMPTETKTATETEVWAKISLPNSEGLRGELPATVPSGDVIQKDDTRVSTFPIRFPVDPATGLRQSAQVTLKVTSGDFSIVGGDQVVVELPPDTDSRTVIFTLEPLPTARTSGRSRVFIDLIYENKTVAQVSVSTQIVARVSAAVAAWGWDAQSAPPDEVLRGGHPLPAPSAAPSGSLEFAPAAPPPPYESAEAAPPAKRSAPASRRRPIPFMQIASGVAALALVAFIGVFLTSRQGSSPQSTTSATQNALLSTASLIASSEIADIAVAPLLGCNGSAGADLVQLLHTQNFDSSLLPDGFTTEAAARRVSNFHVVAWGQCSGSYLTLHYELIHPPSGNGLTPVTSVTTETQPDLLSQSDSRPVRLAYALIVYSVGDTDYAALAQTFGDLAASATSTDERAALSSLQRNSTALVGQTYTPTPPG